jgi:DNA polymerase-1
VAESAPDAAVSNAAHPGGGGLMLIDGNSLAYRAFFALPETIATAAGAPTNALYGLAAMIIKVLIDERPDRVIVCWDPPGPVFRHEAYPEYKAGRAKTPDLLREQKPHFRPLMEAFGFTNVESPGFEADDVIGTLAAQAGGQGEPVLILTSDRDALQLVDDHVSVLATGRGVTDTVRYTPERVVERYGVRPSQMPEFRGLVGDSSDNLPGVRGIGEKGAAQLIQKYGTVDEVLAHAADQTPKRREALEADADNARLSRDLAIIQRETPLDLDLAAVPPLIFDADRLAALRAAFTGWEFESLGRRLTELAGPEAVDAEPAPGRDALEITECALDELGLRVAGITHLAVAIVAGQWAVAAPGPIVFGGPWDDVDAPGLAAGLARASVSCHDAKGLPAAVADAGFCAGDDTMVAAYLLEPRRRGYLLDELAGEAGVEVDADEDHAAAGIAARTLGLAAWQRGRLADEGLDELYRTVELPLVGVLAEMERVGIRLDVARLGEIAGRVRDRVDELRDQIWELAGEEFVIDSPKQLGHVLFEVLGLPTSRRGKTGYSTDRQVLRQLESQHPIVPLIGQYRELTKLDSTYLSALPELIDPGGRVHTTFNQTVAETGRLSSTNPNLQNIPVRTAIGREIRDAFVADDGSVLISCDYSQVELRILAHCSGEPTLASAFRRGEDVHRATAAEVFGIAPEDVDRATRDRAKAVNFGIVYGISDFGLSEQLGISRQDAHTYIQAYLARYPRVQEFIQSTIAAATRDGYVTTLLGRRRPIPELGAATHHVRQLGERLAVNTVIQGSAADIIKVAMVRTRDALRSAGLETRIVLQIHDELLLEAPDEERPTATDIARREMVGAYPLDPPLAVDADAGTTWLEAKS